MRKLPAKKLLNILRKQTRTFLLPQTCLAYAYFFPKLLLQQLAKVSPWFFLGLVNSKLFYTLKSRIIIFFALNVVAILAW